MRCAIDQECDKEKNFFRIPTINPTAKNSEKYKDLTMKRQNAWLNALRRSDIKDKKTAVHVRICSSHFITGKVNV